MATRPAGSTRIAMAMTGWVAAASCLLAAAPAPGRALHALVSAGHGVAPSYPADPMGPLLALVALVAWALLAWLVIVAATALASGLPGMTGRLATVVSAGIAPAAVRRMVQVALGLTVAAGVLGASQAASATPGLPPPPPPPAAAASLDWPIPAESVGGNSPAPQPAAATSSRVTDTPAAVAVVVHTGDSLWSVAADHLPAGASDAQIARVWPAWWAANRAAIGPNPDLIQPGLLLTPPVSPH